MPLPHLPEAVVSHIQVHQAALISTCAVRVGLQKQWPGRSMLALLSHHTQAVPLLAYRKSKCVLRMDRQAHKCGSCFSLSTTPGMLLYS